MFNYVRYVLPMCCLLLACGCARNHYRQQADRQTYDVLTRRSPAAPWMQNQQFTIQPDPRSRFSDPTSPNDPQLPIPAPQLYAYDLPELPPRDPARFRPEIDGDNPLEEVAPSEQYGEDRSSEGSDPQIQLATYDEEAAEPAVAEPADDSEGSTFDLSAGGAELRITPIPKVVWVSIPASCLRRMFEFPSLREEYKRTYGHEPSSQQLDQSPRLPLEDIVDLGLINSRDYQTAKEALFSVALRLTLSRFDYQLKFSPVGNGTAADYTHDRAGGITENTLRVPSTADVDQVLATGGTLVASFANNVVLTFNGPDGFAKDVGSELLLNLSQSFFQRDIVFETLTQNERDVVYAARDYRRFRKQFFRDLAAQYYALIRNYRQIEIDAQDYFSNLRGFNQGEAEYRVGKRSRIQVDQVEQDALNSRSRLIATCNTLESGLDNLKISLGLPTEQPINIDLTELEELTLRDEVTVAAELVSRARRNLAAERSRGNNDRDTLLNAAIRLCSRLLNWRRLLQRLDQSDSDNNKLQVLLARLEVDSAQEKSRVNRNELLKEQNKLALEKAQGKEIKDVDLLRVFRRIDELLDSVMTMVDSQLQLAAVLPDGHRLERFEAQLDSLKERLKELREKRDEDQLAIDRLPTFVRTAEELLADADKLVDAVYALVKQPKLTREQERARTLQQVDWLLDRSQNANDEQAGGLAPVELDMDDAMLTALVKRFDLMNRRGILADFWRQIKLRADDLKSILNLRAQQTIRTRADVNRGFDFTWDESTTNLRLEFDAPLNRRAQRNAFRQSLIDYNVALRNLMGLEDDIKLEVRDDLRDLQLDREQYSIAIASAALANERVRSTRLQWQKGIGNVNARDLLEAQRAYTASVSAIANQHIGYIVDRIDLFFDLELLEVNSSGFWPELYDEQHQPTPHFAMPNMPPYGVLPRRVWYSHKVKRMLRIPPGTPAVYQTEPSDEPEAVEAPEPQEFEEPPLPEPTE